MRENNKGETLENDPTAGIVAQDVTGQKQFVVRGEVHTMADESYTSHNTNRLDVEGTVKKIMTTEYVQNELKGIPNV